MKQITPEIKARVFALYWGQKILRLQEGFGKLATLFIVNPSNIDADNKYPSYLEVKPLSSITDEDAEVVLQLYDPVLDFSKVSSSTKNSISLYYESGRFGDYYTVYVKELSIEQADYLRSKGYALPAFGYSVDELVEAGVFKLKEVNNE